MIDVIRKLLKLGYFLKTDNGQIAFDYIKPGKDSPPTPEEVTPLLEAIKADKASAIPIIQKLIKKHIVKGETSNSEVDEALYLQSSGVVEWVRVYVHSSAKWAIFVGIQKESDSY